LHLQVLDLSDTPPTIYQFGVSLGGLGGKTSTISTVKLGNFNYSVTFTFVLPVILRERERERVMQVKKMIIYAVDHAVRTLKDRLQPIFSPKQ
jgi:hypothetical protein